MVGISVSSGGSVSHIPRSIRCCSLGFIVDNLDFLAVDFGRVTPSCGSIQLVKREFNEFFIFCLPQRPASGLSKLLKVSRCHKV